MLRDGRLLMSRTFERGDEALAWAEEERVGLVQNGWQVPSTCGDTAAEANLDG